MWGRKGCNQSRSHLRNFWYQRRIGGTHRLPPPEASKAFFRCTPPALVEDLQPDNYGGDGAQGPARLRFPTVALLS